jgi:DNA polymerase I
VRRLADFREIVAVDFEYVPFPGGVTPVCCCARELRSGREYRVWQDQLARLKEPPYPHGRDSLFLAFHAPAELSCYIELGWEMPNFILDLCIEFRQQLNGVVDKKQDRDLNAALRYFGLTEVLEKEYWRDVILAGGPHDEAQKAGVLSYCMADVDAAADLLKAMGPKLPVNLDVALVRGRYGCAVADTQRYGIPIDAESWEELLENRTVYQRAIAAWMNKTSGLTASNQLYERASFRLEAFERWLKQLGLAGKWPVCRKSGHRALDKDTFKLFAWHPQVAQLAQVRATIQQLRKPSFEVVNGRNYYSIKPFGALTGRNATSRCVIQAPKWVHSMITPAPGEVLIHIDFEQEEFLIGGVLAGDDAVIEAYRSDPYLSFARSAKLMPATGTKESHPAERALAKQLMLATQFGMSSWGLARRLEVSQRRAEALLEAHRRVFHKFWRWSDETVSVARWRGKIETVFGWQMAVDDETPENTLRNFPVQGAGAEVLRYAHLLLWQNNVRVVAPVHDAFLIRSNASELEDVVNVTRRCMERASESVLSGHRLRTEMLVIHQSERLLGARGRVMWDLIQAIKNRLSLAA